MYRLHVDDSPRNNADQNSIRTSRHMRVQKLMMTRTFCWGVHAYPHVGVHDEGPHLPELFVGLAFLNLQKPTERAEVSFKVEYVATLIKH
jgi:hypothetical protein